jgi:hypothetical protein
MPNPRPVIGEFRTTANNAPRGETPPPPAPEPTSVQAPSQETPAAPEAEAELSPVERYRKRLESAKITLQEASTIYDAVIDKGYYEEYVRVGSNRAVFRTRMYEDQLRVQSAIEAMGPKFQATQDELVGRYNLAASLYEWKGKPLKHDTEDDFQSVLSLVRRMPAPVVAMLADRLAQFDAKTMIVFSEGATDSF